jgi:two-component system NtrC family response regulator
VALVETRLIREALARAGGNRTQAAKLLGISRNGLAIKIDRLGLTG